MKPIRILPNGTAKRILSDEKKPVHPLPKWMMDIVKQECNELSLPLPQEIGYKKFRFRNWIGGATYTPADGNPSLNGTKLLLLYGTGFDWAGTPDEAGCLIHELAHWTCELTRKTKTTILDMLMGGHTTAFYKELTRLTLKYGIPLDEMFEREADYAGNQAYSGLEEFDRVYNGN